MSRIRRFLSLSIVALLTLVLGIPTLRAQSTDKPLGWKKVSPDSARIAEDTEFKLLSALDKATAERSADCPLPGGLDHVANGTGLRNAGWGTIRLRGVPPRSVAVDAVVFWGLVDPNPQPQVTINFEGHPVPARLLGVAQEPCWNGGSYALYVANVLHLIPPAINGDYQVDGFPSAVSQGGDPWTPPTATPMAEGASLVLTFSNASIPANSVVYTHYGPGYFDALNSPFNVNNALFPPLPGNSYLRQTRIGADGQIGASLTPFFGVPNESTAINGFQIKGPGAPVDQDSDWNGDDGVPLNQLWDTHSTDIRGLIGAGAGNYIVTYVSNGDCVNPSVHVLTAF
jgi:hypothetical protein